MRFLYLIKNGVIKLRKRVEMQPPSRCGTVTVTVRAGLAAMLAAALGIVGMHPLVVALTPPRLFPRLLSCQLECFLIDNQCLLISAA